MSGTKRSQAPAQLIWVTPSATVAEALAKMDEVGVTQLPVIDEGRAVGSVRENRVLAKVVRNSELLKATVDEVMEPSFPTVDVDVSSDEVSRRLRTSPAVLVEEYGRIVGIITRHDVLDMSLKT